MNQNTSIKNLKAKEQVLYDIHEALGIKWGDDPYSVIASLKLSQADTKRLIMAAQKVKPIVGAAVASASNEIRPLREKAYNELREAIVAAMNQQPK